MKRSLSNAGSKSKNKLNINSIQQSSTCGIMGCSSSKRILNQNASKKAKNTNVPAKEDVQRNPQASLQSTLPQKKTSQKLLQPIKSSIKQQQIGQMALPGTSRRSNQLRAIKAIRTPLLDFYSHQKAMIIKNKRQNEARVNQQRKRLQQIANTANKTFYNTAIIKRKQAYSPNSTLVNNGFYTTRNEVDRNQYTNAGQQKKRFSISRDTNKATNQFKEKDEIYKYQVQRPKPSIQLNPVGKNNTNHISSTKRIMNVTSIDWKKPRIEQQRNSSQKRDNQKTSVTRGKDFEIRSRPTLNQTARDGFGNYNFKQMSSSNGFKNLQISQDHKNYLNKFQLMKEIGKGMYGTVYLAREKHGKNSFRPLRFNKQDQQEEENPQDPQEKRKIEEQKLQIFLDNQDQPKYAIKVYEKFKMNNDPSKFKNIRKQINIMSNLNHPGVIKLYQNVQTLTKINLVVQYAGSQSLLDYLKQYYPLSMKQCQQIGRQLLQALVYLHEKNIVHRDIKLQNILIHQEKPKFKALAAKSTYLTQKSDIKVKQKSRYEEEAQQPAQTYQGEKITSQTIKFQSINNQIVRPRVPNQREFQLKLIDYGFSTLTNRNRKCNAICGTPNYMAPQLISKKQYIGQQVDLWAYGVVMYTIAEGRHPFKAENMSELERIIKNGKFQFRKIKDKDYQHFIRRILKPKGSQRPRAVQLLNSMFLEKQFQ